MKTNPLRSSMIGLALLEVVGSAYVLGRSISPSACSDLVWMPSLLAVVLASLAISGYPPASESTLEQRGGGLVLVWVVFAVATSQFMWIYSEWDVGMGIAYLALPLVGAVVLLESRRWVAAAACLSALFAGTFALTFSTMHLHAGAGLIGVWRS